MIELNCTMQDLLEEIGASSDSPRGPLTDPADSAFVDLDDVSLHVDARRRDEILSPLQEAFSRRFSGAPADALDRDLLYLLKKGLGNAFKHGNHDDPSRPVRVEVVSTRKGAVVAIRDQGPGFDVETAVRGLRRDRQYFHNKGSGFRNFEKARARVSWADGGRTLLLGYRCDAGDEAATDEFMRAGGVLADPDHVLSIVKESIPHFRDGKWSALSCSVNPLRVGPGDRFEFALVVRYEKGGSPKPRERTWTGRVLREHEARADLRAGKLLKGDPLGGRGGLSVPKANEAFARHPGLVFHKVNASMDLSAYLVGAGESEVRDAFAKVGLGLRDLHGKPIELDARETREESCAAILARADRVEERLDGAGGDSIATLRRALEEPPSPGEWRETPTHGQMGWDCVLFDGGLFYLWHLEEARMGHPGFDVGGFIADLLLSALPHELGEAFLTPYFAELHAPWSAHLPFFTAASVLERLDRMLDRGSAAAEVTAACDRAAALSV